MNKIYLAGPEVFLANCEKLAKTKKQICESYEFVGVFPLDTELDLCGHSRSKQGHLISEANEALMHSCDLLIANMTPFRGPSMDVGTAFEVGFMRSLGRPVLAYSNTIGSYFERVEQYHIGALQPRRGENGQFEDAQGFLVESFDMIDNLMIDGAVLSSGGEVYTSDIAPEKRFLDMEGFEKCVRKAVEIMASEERQ